MKTLLLIVSLALAGNLAAAQQLKLPASGKIRVAFVLTDGATMIDFAGPWEVFQDAMVPQVHPEHGHDPFELYTVSETKDPLKTSAGMTVVPDYTFADAPTPNIVVVPAQRGSAGLVPWLQKVSKQSDLVMSVCTGAFKLGAAGLLDGKKATTHHDFYDSFRQRFPKVRLVESQRFVQSDAKTFTAGGLTSGIDLALHIVELYFGREVAQRTADYMEYQSKGWMMAAAENSGSVAPGK